MAETQAMNRLARRIAELKTKLLPPPKPAKECLDIFMVRTGDENVPRDDAHYFRTNQYDTGEQIVSIYHIREEAHRRNEAHRKAHLRRLQRA
jgi:hypothetical protein